MIGPHKILSNPPSKFLAWPSLNLVMHTAIANLFVMQCWPLTGPAEEGGNRWLFANASDCEMDDALCDHNHKLPPADFCTHRQTLISSIRVSLQGPGGDDYICPPAGRYDSSVSGDGPMYLQWCISTAYTCLDYTIQCFSPYSSRDHLPAEQKPPGDLTDARRAARDRSMSAHVSSGMILPLGLHRDHQTQ